MTKIILLALISLSGPALAIVQPVTQAYPGTPWTMTGTVTGYVANKPGTVLTVTNTGGYIYARQDNPTVPWTATIPGGYIYARPDGTFNVNLVGVPFSQTVHGNIAISSGSISNTAFVAYQGEFLWGVDLTRVAFSQTIHGTVSTSNTQYQVYPAPGAIFQVGGTLTTTTGVGTSVYCPSGYSMPVTVIGGVTILEAAEATATDYQVSVGTSPASLTGVSTPGARRIFIFNPATEPLYLGGSNTRTWTGQPVPAGGSLLIDNYGGDTGKLWGIYPTVTRLVQVVRN